MPHCCCTGGPGGRQRGSSWGRAGGRFPGLWGRAAGGVSAGEEDGPPARVPAAARRPHLAGDGTLLLLVRAVTLQTRTVSNNAPSAARHRERGTDSAGPVGAAGTPQHGGDPHPGAGGWGYVCPGHPQTSRPVPGDSGSPDEGRGSPLLGRAPPQLPRPPRSARGGAGGGAEAADAGGRAGAGEAGQPRGLSVVFSGEGPRY